MHLKLKMLINIESPRSYSTTHIYSLHVFLQGVRVFTRRITITHTCIFTGSIYKKSHKYINLYTEYLHHTYIICIFTGSIYFISNITHACIFLDICRTQHILYIHLVYFQRVFTSCRRQLMTMKSD